MSISRNYPLILEKINNAAVKSGRKPSDITLVAVTKNHSVEAISTLYDLGHRVFGESRLQEVLPKISSLPQDCRWHFIGSLQKNKAQKTLEVCELIHSVDSLKLAQKLSQCAVRLNCSAQILLQANTSGEMTKHGYHPRQWKEEFEELLSLPNLSLTGMMTMAPLNAHQSVVRDSFKRLRELRDELRMISGNASLLHDLSMGMSEDYELAIEEGATLLRIGSALFA